MVSDTLSVCGFNCTGVSTWVWPEVRAAQLSFVLRQELRVQVPPSLAWKPGSRPASRQPNAALSLKGKHGCYLQVCQQLCDALPLSLTSSATRVKNYLLFFNKFVFWRDSPELSRTVYTQESRRTQLASLRFTHDPPLRWESLFLGSGSQANSRGRAHQGQFPGVRAVGACGLPHAFIGETCLCYLPSCPPL